MTDGAGWMIGSLRQPHPAWVECIGAPRVMMDVLGKRVTRREWSPDMMTPKFSISSTSGGHRILIAADGTRLETPPVENLAFYAGLGVLAAAEIIEWPVAVVLTVGHVLMGLTHRPALRGLGEAIDAV